MSGMEIVGLDTALADAVRAEVERQLAERPVGWLDCAGAARYLSMTEKAVRDAERRGLPARRVGARLYFSPSELDAWVRGEV
jgi:hypothetical protein